MPIDPRIALAGVSPTYDFMGAFNTSRAAAQTAQANQMAAQRRADAQAALNAMRQPVSPAVQPAPAMQPGSSGPPITGAPLPSVNAMGAGAPMPAAAAPAAPVTAARDMSPLYQYLDIPEIKNYVDEMARLETARAAAAGRAIDDERLGATANQQRVDYTINQALPMLAQLTRDPSDASLDRLAVGFLSTPGIDRAFAEQRIAEIRSVPPEARPALIADLMNVNPQGRAARAATFPDVRTFNDGTVMGGLPLSDPAALTKPLPERRVTLTPNQQRDEENREEDRQRRLADAQVELDADAEAKQAEADALVANRADNDDIAAAQARAAAALAAANANRRLRSGPPPRPAPTAPPAAGSGLPAVGPEGQRVRNRNTNRIFVSRGGRWVPE
jgi:hypothetical protein